jgi:catalase
MGNTPVKSVSIKKRYTIIMVLMAYFVLGFLYAADWFGRHDMTAQKFINLQEGTKPSFSFRRAHAKGICLQGEFIAMSKRLKLLSRLLSARRYKPTWKNQSLFVVF